MGADDEKEARKAKIRQQLEEQAASGRKKKGFMTPERKKKLRLLLRKKAAEELKKEQELNAAERRKVIEERCGKPRHGADTSEAELKSICKLYYEKIMGIEWSKYDLEKALAMKDLQIYELNFAVNDMRGKFIKPTLKKVSKYENKFAKLQKKAAEFNFRNQLKTVKKKEFSIAEDETAEKKPDWALGEKEGKAKTPVAD
ncbi:troponin I-like isoform X2 [Tigriopus californicus]|uniref:troponin I-like isoform X2 n=1 Tax=Tigriopus californicus TaxID=6832 RepID=UPI0027D9F057|nr:troponin I-like isoform X2 [Tigriopus californicus]